MALMHEIRLRQLVSSFGDVIEVLKVDEKFIVRINEVFVSDKEFHFLSDANMYAEDKKAGLDFWHVLIGKNGEVISVSVFPSGLKMLQTQCAGSQIVKISIAEATELGIIDQY